MLLITSSAAPVCLLALGVLEQIAALTVLDDSLFAVETVSRPHSAAASEQELNGATAIKNGSSTLHIAEQHRDLLPANYPRIEPRSRCTSGQIAWISWSRARPAEEEEEVEPGSPLAFSPPVFFLSSSSISTIST
ncbi:unnamed protein product [Pleuronectes platessa]|uniref:Secreted protein n=1 Tax=Pleuronectes platessa TaxID=8262 RepID=A0A9N7U5R7_PLEPL|nr:unnamed protein product [Pleuronectes platessa]